MSTLPSSVALAAMLGFAMHSVASAQAPAWVGKWYIDEPGYGVKVCKGRKGSTEGLLTYSQKEMAGYENTCRITKVTPKGTADEIVMRCSGEGMSSSERESIEVKDGKLRRTLVVEGKAETFRYSRCPY